MENYIDPTAEIFRALKDLPQDHPIDMLNLVSLHDHAKYEDGGKATGAEAYAAYGKLSGPIFAGVGGEIIWSGDPQIMIIGPQKELWDIAFIARYPSPKAFLEMVFNPEYQAIVYHRQAAVKNSRLIRNKARDSGAGFGE
ncbi:MAG: DUF1330 domain-containing protein [Rhizobiaceae bacterium]